MASHLIDLGNTCTALTSIAAAGGGLGTMSGQIGIVSGLVMPASGGIVGMACHMGNADSYCNLVVQGMPDVSPTSGMLRIQVQTADANTSGDYTDPTSGMSQFPSQFSSGGMLWINSGGLLGSTLGQLQTGSNSGIPASGYAIQSGFIVSAPFVRPHTFVRARVVSGDFYVGTLHVSFISQSRVTGQSGGSTPSPGSGAVSV